MKTILSFSKKMPSLVFVAAVALSSCKKDNNVNNANNPDPELAVEAVQNEVTASSQFNDVFDMKMCACSADASEDAGVESRNGVTLSQIRI